MMLQIQRIRFELFQLLIIAFVFRLNGVSGNNNLCLLCSNGAAGLIRPMWNIEDETDREVKNCVTKSLEMAANMPVNSEQCRAAVQAHRSPCCDREAPSESAQTAQVVTGPPRPPKLYPEGEFDSCDICKGDGPPGDPKMVINFLYLSAGTCEDYYWLGLGGNFQRHLCNPLKYYGYRACGCGKIPQNQAPQTTITVNGGTPSNNTNHGGDGNNNGNGISNTFNNNPTTANQAGIGNNNGNGLSNTSNNNPNGSPNMLPSGSVSAANTANTATSSTQNQQSNVIIGRRDPPPGFDSKNSLSLSTSGRGGARGNGRRYLKGSTAKVAA